jgi:hypothetical protein
MFGHASVVAEKRPGVDHHKNPPSPDQRLDVGLFDGLQQCRQIRDAARFDQDSLRRPAADDGLDLVREILSQRAADAAI